MINRIKFWKNKKDFYKYLYTQPESVERNNFQTDLDEYNDIPKLSQTESNSIAGLLTEKGVAFLKR